MKWSKIIILGFVLTGPVFLLTEENIAEKPESSTSTKKAASEKYEDYLVKQFGEHLKQGDWLARCMAIVSLSKMDAPRVTEKLLNTMEKDRKPIVQIFAWEALHARQGILTSEQREKWKKASLII